MKIGPMDFNQPSTWRGLIGLAAIGGISVSPAIADQIALLAATLIALIEMFRDEDRAKKAPPPAPVMDPDPCMERAADGMRPVPSEPETARSPESFGFSDR